LRWRHRHPAPSLACLGVGITRDLLCHGPARRSFPGMRATGPAWVTYRRLPADPPPECCRRSAWCSPPGDSALTASPRTRTSLRFTRSDAGQDGTRRPGITRAGIHERFNALPAPALRTANLDHCPNGTHAVIVNGRRGPADVRAGGQNEGRPGCRAALHIRLSSRRLRASLHRERPFRSIVTMASYCTSRDSFWDCSIGIA
jgi:hypothetical protein